MNREIVNRKALSTFYSLFTIHDLLVYDPQKVRYLRNDPTGRRRVGPGHRLVELRDAEASDDLFLLLRVPDRASIILDRDISAVFIFYFLCHLFIFDFRIAIFDLAKSILKTDNRKSKIENRKFKQVPQPASRAILRLRADLSFSKAR